MKYCELFGLISPSDRAYKHTIYQGRDMFVFVGCNINQFHLYKNKSYVGTFDFEQFDYDRDVDKRDFA